MSLRQDLIKVAKAHPELRVHLVPLLKKARYTPQGRTPALKVAYILADLVGQVITEPADVRDAFLALAKVATYLAKDVTDPDPNVAERVTAAIQEEFLIALLRILKPYLN